MKEEEKLELQERARAIKSLCDEKGLKEAPTLLGGKVTKDVADAVMEVINEQGLGISLAVTKEGVMPIADAYTRRVKDTAKAFMITNNAEKEVTGHELPKQMNFVEAAMKKTKQNSL